MKYTDYKLLDQYFTNHSDEWTDEEINNIITTFPETRYDDEKIIAVEQLKKDVENNVLKKSKYHFNGASAISYANSHEWFKYRKASTFKSAGLMIQFIGEDYIVDDLYDVNQLLNKLKDNKEKVKKLSNIYKRKEYQALKDNDKKQYENIHKDRIEQGQRVVEMMRGTSINVCEGLEKALYSRYYNAKIKSLVASNYIDWNNYYEITDKKRNLLSVEAGKQLEKVCDDLAKELSEIIDIYNGKFLEIIRNGVDKYE